MGVMFYVYLEVLELCFVCYGDYGELGVLVVDRVGFFGIIVVKEVVYDCVGCEYGDSEVGEEE